jgi:hypothetical protein
MTVPFAPESRHAPLRDRAMAVVPIAAAAVVAKLPPHRIRWVLESLRRGARPATPDQARAARAAVVALSARCAGEACLQRSLATVMLCRLRGVWPTWRSGVRVHPFQAHAWVEVDGEMIDEPHPQGYFHPIMTVPSP